MFKSTVRKSVDKKTYDNTTKNSTALAKRLKKEKLDHLDLFIVIEEEAHWKEKKLGVRNPNAGSPGWSDWILFEELFSGSIRKSSPIGARITIIEKWSGSDASNG